MSLASHMISLSVAYFATRFLAPEYADKKCLEA